jgi:hypothetical protein
MGGKVLLHLGPHAAPDSKDMAAAHYAMTIDPTSDGRIFLFVVFSQGISNSKFGNSSNRCDGAFP